MIETSNIAISETELLASHQVCAAEVVRQLRGPLSQRELSEKLGFSFNQVGKWERGITQIKWDDFVHLCQKLSLPIESNFRNMFWTFDGDFTSIRALRTLISNLELAPREKQKFQPRIRRWLSGDAQPDLAEVLEIMDLVPAMLIGFLSRFVDCSQLDSLKSKYGQYKTQLELIYQDPLCVFVNAALQLQEYQCLPEHDEVMLARHATCSVDHLRRILGLMTVYGIIIFDGRKYLPNKFDFSFSGLPDAKLRGLTKYVSELAADRYPLQPTQPAAGASAGPQRNPSVSSVRVNALSQESAKKVMDLVSEFHNKVSQIVQEDQAQPKNNVQVILIHSFASTINSK